MKVTHIADGMNEPNEYRGVTAVDIVGNTIRVYRGELWWKAEIDELTRLHIDTEKESQPLPTTEAQ